MTRNLLAILILFSLNGTCQSLANYASTRDATAAYSSIQGTGNPVRQWRNTSNSPEDDNRSEQIDIGFDFWYNGVRYTKFSVSTNGFIDFSSSTADGGPLATAFGYDNTTFSASNAGSSTRPAIAAFYDDLSTQGSADALHTSVLYQVTGTAPNRTLTVEWVNMGVYLNNTPSLNFQVRLVETSGRVLIHYGSMNPGSHLFSYTMGLNGQVISIPPTAAQLKTLQSVNANSFGNTPQNNHSAMPANSSRYLFAPPAPANPAGSLNFSGVSASAMTLGWSDWATNEIGYVIYNSTDNINFSFVTQTGANATSTQVTGLTPGTTYFWRVYAVTEGCLSNPLSGTLATAAPGNKVSNSSGNWNTPGTWVPNGVPSATDNVTIANGNIVFLNANVQCNNLSIGQGASGALLFNNGGTGYSLMINGNLTVNTGASLIVPPNSNATSTLTLKGNVVNNGTINLSYDFNSRALCIFDANRSLSVTGTGINHFYLIRSNLGSISNTLNITVPSFSAATGFLDLQNGVFRLTSSNPATITPFTASTTIRPSCGIWLNGSLTTYSIPASVTLNGLLAIESGTMLLGNNAAHDLSVAGGSLTMAGGALNVAGKIFSSGTNNLSFTSISGGTITVPSFSSTNTTFAPFHFANSASRFNMSGGAIVIAREGGTGAQDLGYVNGSTGTVTGGTLQIGNATTPAAQTMQISSALPVGNLVVNSVNATGKLLTNSLTVLQNVSLNGGHLSANNLDITLGGNWTNAGGTFTPGTAVVTFSSNTAQLVSRTGGETFNHLIFTGTGVKTFSSPVSASGNFSVASGATVDVSPVSHSLEVKGNFINNGSFASRTGLVALTGTVQQTIGGSSITDFYNLTLGNPAGATMVTGERLLGALTLTAGLLSAANNLTMVSTATTTARIAPITGSGDITGNITVQRYIPGGATGWALLGTPISSPLTLSDWDDDIYITCPTCPDGTAGGFKSIYTYDETVTGLYDDYYAYIPLNTINDPIIPGKGYWVYMGNGQYTTTPIVMDVTGTVRKFNYTIPLDYTNYGSAADDGWNLICNPYPSPVSWTALRGTTPNIDNSIYVYNADLNGGAGGYASFVNGVSSPAVGSGGIGDEIPMWQGFYVHSTGATALNATESVKSGGNPTFLKASSSPSVTPLLRLNLKRNAWNDETVLYMSAGATDQFDNGFDSYKMRGQNPNAPYIALEKNGKEFQINGVQPISGNFSMPLKTITGYTGTYTLSASEISNFPMGACINLYDSFTGISTDLRTSVYVFTLSASTTVARFTLNISNQPLSISDVLTQPACSAPNAGMIVAQGNSAGPWNYKWTSNGATVKTSLNKNSADTLGNLVSGSYQLEVNTVGSCDNNTTQYQVNPVVYPASSFSSPDSADLSINPWISFVNTSQNASSQLWNFGDGSQSALSSPTHSYSSPGVYLVKLIAYSANGCADTSSKKIYVTDVITALPETGSALKDLEIRTLGGGEYVLIRRALSEETCQFKLYDITGRLLSDMGSRQGKEIQLHVDLRAYSSGIYLLNIDGAQGRKVIRLKTD